MGYYSRFNIEFKAGTPEDDQRKVIKWLRSTSDGANFALDDFGESKENVKWYDVVKDCKPVAKKFPNVYFCVVELGEDALDINFHYFNDTSYATSKAIIKSGENALFPITL